MYHEYTKQDCDVTNNVAKGDTVIIEKMSFQVSAEVKRVGVYTVDVEWQHPTCGAIRSTVRKGDLLEVRQGIDSAFANLASVIYYVAFCERSESNIRIVNGIPVFGSASCLNRQRVTA